MGRWGRAVVLIAMLVVVPAAWAEEEGEHEGGPFGAPLAVPNLAHAEFEQDPPLPETCDMPPKDATFKALGRSVGPDAVAHHSGGRVIQEPPSAFPQMFPTGDYTIEPNIGVTTSGAILVDALRCGRGPGVYQPVVLRSTDQGQSFRDVSPTVAGQPSHPFTEDPYLYVDKRTGRLFSTDIDTVVACQPLSISDDAGKTWTETQTGCGLADHANIFTGPAPAGG